MEHLIKIDRKFLAILGLIALILVVMGMSMGTSNTVKGMLTARLLQSTLPLYSRGSLKRK